MYNFRELKQNLIKYLTKFTKIEVKKMENKHGIAENSDKNGRKVHKKGQKCGHRLK